jgi:hypothetical protein
VILHTLCSHMSRQIVYVRIMHIVRVVLLRQTMKSELTTNENESGRGRRGLDLEARGSDMYTASV